MKMMLRIYYWTSVSNVLIIKFFVHKFSTNHISKYYSIVSHWALLTLIAGLSVKLSYNSLEAVYTLQWACKPFSMNYGFGTKVVKMHNLWTRFTTLCEPKCYGQNKSHMFLINSQFMSIYTFLNKIAGINKNAQLLSSSAVKNHTYARMLR